MKKPFLKISKILLFILPFFSGCDLLTELEQKQDFKLKGTWIDKESFALSFLDFYSDKQASFCLYRKDFERRDTFNYRLFADSIAIDYIGDNDPTESLHKLIFRDSNTIEISNLTIIPENPDKTYYKKDILSDKQNDSISFGFDDLYYDKELDFRLEIESILNDSRCPKGVECFWAGNAEVRFDLIVEGNYHYQFNLNTNLPFKQDTLIRGIHYKLIDVLPYPDYHNDINYKDYRVKMLVIKE